MYPKRNIFKNIVKKEFKIIMLNKFEENTKRVKVNAEKVSVEVVRTVLGSTLK